MFSSLRSVKWERPILCDTWAMAEGDLAFSLGKQYLSLLPVSVL